MRQFGRERVRSCVRTQSWLVPPCPEDDGMDTASHQTNDQGAAEWHNPDQSAIPPDVPPKCRRKV
eukprot:scaffold39707_cov58-Attheya_sp.AAC.1